MWNNVPMTLRTGEIDDVFTDRGDVWYNGSVYYTNIPPSIKSSFPMYGTTDSNTGDSNILNLAKPMVGYMFRHSLWNPVPLGGWEKIGMGSYLGPRNGPRINLYRREFSQGVFIIDNNSAMYLFEDVEDRK